MAEQQKKPQKEQDINQLLKVRREKLANLQAEGKDPFVITKYDVTHHSMEIKDNYDTLEGKEVSVAGRMMFKRVMGKASFCNVQDLQGNIQAYVARDDIGEDSYKDFKKYDVGDILGIKGFVFKTKTGEISIHAKEVTLLSKSLQILPEKYHGLTDTDTRYRQRYVDLIMNEDVKDTFIKHERHSSMYPAASFQLIIAMGIGTVLSKLLSLTGMTFPIYIGAMIAAACIRNLGEYGGKFTVYMGEINDIGGICLSLFLGMAMITLKIWQLAELALPLVVLLAGQTLFMILYSFVIVYNVMGRDYDAAVIVSGTCGFGMGATPNAMANMQAVCDKYSPSVKAYLLIPLVGSLFADFINSLVITVFINFI